MDDLAAPFLPEENGLPNGAGEHSRHDPEAPGSMPPTSSPCNGRCRWSGGVANVAITAVGAGMLAMPKAYATVGLLAGGALTCTACLLTYFSGAVIITHCAKRGLDSYGALVRAEFGRAGGATLCSSIVLHVFGVMVVYLIIIGDMLVGSAPHWQGILPFFLNRHDAPWFLTRWFVSGALVAGAVGPMLLSRDLSTVSRFSRLSVAMVLGLAATTIGLAAVAVAQGTAAGASVLPPPEAGASARRALSSVLTVLAVNTLAFTCHFNLVPIHNSLRDNRTSAMLSVVRHAVALCALLYASLAVAGCTLFGRATEGDFLKNLTVGFAAGVVGQRPAEALVAFIVAANTVNLLVNFVLKVWAVRDGLTELMLHRPAAALPLPQWYSLTAVVVLLAYAASVVIPSVWFIVTLLGSTACVVFSYVFPGLLLLRRAESAGGRAAGAAGVALAALMAGVAVYNALSGSGDL